MSEFQQIAFRAIDAPVSEENLTFMHCQSSRAEITPWSFDNEYHFGDFRGNAVEMLRRGYDFHLHYANFGIRKLLIRLPKGFPDPQAAKPYLGPEAVQFLADKQGKGGTLSIEPIHEPGDLEDVWDFDGLIERLLPLRTEILEGDLRPLYLAHLAVASDGEHNPVETIEGPLPAGLDQLSDAQQALAELYGLSDSIIAAAAQGCPPLAERSVSQNTHAQWLKRLPAATKDAWLAQWMADKNTSCRSEILAEYRNSLEILAWPTIPRNRTIAELRAAAEEIQDKAKRKAAANTARQRAKRLASMAANPSETLREIEALVAQRSTMEYRKAATLLSELREALADSKQAGLAEKQAKKLQAKNPTLRRLVSELRREGFLPK